MADDEHGLIALSKGQHGSDDLSVPGWSVRRLLVPSLIIWAVFGLVEALLLAAGFSPELMAAEHGPVEILQLILLIISFVFAVRATRQQCLHLMKLLAFGTACLTVGLFFAEVQSCEGLDATAFCLPRLFKRTMIALAALVLLLMLIRNVDFLWKLKFSLMKPTFLWPGALLFAIYLAASELEDFHYFISEENLELLGMILLAVFSYRLSRPTLTQ